MLRNIYYGYYVLLMLGLIALSYGQTVTYDTVPQIYQLYPRDLADNDSAIVTINGSVDNIVEYDSITVDVKENNVAWKHLKQELTYNGGSASFNLNPKIYADTVEFRFEINFWDAGSATTDSIADSVVCGDVYLIQGQSNAVASERDEQFNPYTAEWVRSFGVHTEKGGFDAFGQQSTALDTNWGLAHAAMQRTHAYVGIWGLRLGKLITENYGIPVCIINGAADGTNIKKHTRNSTDPDNLDDIYGRLLWRTKRAGVVNNVNALIWWQGEGNTSTEALALNYYDKFPNIRSGWKIDYVDIKKIYTTQLHAGHGAYANLTREFQRNFSGDDGDTTEIIAAHHIGGFVDNHHFTSNGYDIFAERVFNQIAKDFYNLTDTVDVEPPDISRAFFIDQNRDVIVLEFNNANSIVWQNDTTIDRSARYLKDYFYFHTEGSPVDTFNVDTAMVFGNQLRLDLIGPSEATMVTYLPNQYYNLTDTLYEGPWLQNSKGIPALSFYQFSIDAEFGDDPLPVTLSVFTAENVGEGVRIKWRTESEIQNAGFILLRKSENQNRFTEIANYQYVPALRGQGTTNQATDYHYTDYVVSPGRTYYYMLQDVDYSGKKSNHGPVKVTVKKNGIPLKTELYQNYPNPFNPYTIIGFFIPDDQMVTITIYDILGRKIDTILQVQKSAGFHEIKFNARNLNSGSYFYEIRTRNFIDRNKMVLIK